MRTRVSIALNGVELHSISNAIVIQGISEQSPNWNIATGAKAEAIGQFVNRFEKRYREVSVRFALAIKRDMPLRVAIIQQVNAWAAKGGVLSVDYRDGQRLRVICAALPTINTDKWAEDYTITFRAYRVPFWESVEKTQVTISAATSGTTTMNLRETAGGKLCAIATNGSGSALTSLGVFANGKRIALTDMSVASGSSVVIDYDENDIQRIRKVTGSSSTSILEYRTTDSDDYVPLEFGSNTIIVSSGVAVSWTLYTYGRWE